VPNNGVQALSSSTALDPAVKLGTGAAAGLGSPVGHSHDESAGSGVTPLPFQTFTQAEPSTPAVVKSSDKPKTAQKHAPLVQELKAIHLAAPPDVSVGYAVSKDGLAIQVKMTNTTTGDVVRSFDIKAADLTKAMKSHIVLKGSQVDARS
jgi:hypothetical protein